MAGRPSDYSQELANSICDIIATTSKGMRAICKEDGMPAMQTIFRWLNEKPEFSEQYARAKVLQADILAQEILEISDDGSRDDTPFTGGNHVQRDRLKTDSRKWLAGKLNPKKYGDKLDVTSDGEKINQEIIIKGQKFADPG